jgi:hypothetical protein
VWAHTSHTWPREAWRLYHCSFVASTSCSSYRPKNDIRSQPSRREHRYTITLIHIYLSSVTYRKSCTRTSVCTNILSGSIDEQRFTSLKRSELHHLVVMTEGTTVGKAEMMALSRKRLNGCCNPSDLVKPSEKEALSIHIVNIVFWNLVLLDLLVDSVEIDLIRANRVSSVSI